LGQKQGVKSQVTKSENCKKSFTAEIAENAERVKRGIGAKAERHEEEKPQRSTENTERKRLTTDTRSPTGVEDKLRGHKLLRFSQINADF